MFHKNLLERAKPELLSAIAQYKVTYPNTADAMESMLSESYGVSFLTYGAVLQLRTIMLTAKEKFNMNDPWEWFQD